MKLPRFYPIFDQTDWLRRALPLGVKLVQIRIKDQPAPRLMGELALAQELCREHGATLVVNDYWREAIELGCDFVHLGQEDLDQADIPPSAAPASGWGFPPMTMPSWTAPWPCGPITSRWVRSGRRS